MSHYSDIHPDHIDPETNQPYANYSSDCLDTSFHDHEMAVDATPEEHLSSLADVLLRWRCPSCGGAKVYLTRTRDGARRVPCTVCAESGLHPEALIALKAAGCSTDIGPSPLERAKHNLAQAMMNQVGVDWDEVCDSVEFLCDIHPSFSAEEMANLLDREAYRYEDM